MAPDADADADADAVDFSVTSRIPKSGSFTLRQRCLQAANLMYSVSGRHVLIDIR